MTEKYKILLDKYFRKEATTDEIALLVKWISNPQASQEFEAYCEQHWQTSSSQIDKETEREMWNAIAAKAKKDNKRFRLNPVFYRIAVSILLPVCIFMGAYIAVDSYTANRKATESFQVMADRGQKASVVLPDGTKAWLNSATRLTYDFEADERKVNLEGEAYFEVAKDPHKKFIVYCQDLRIEALGTAFNVKGYTTDESVIVALMEGSVKIYNETNSAILAPNQLLAFNKTDNTFTRSDIKDQREIDFWRRNILYFRSATFADIAQTLERMYGVTVKFADEKLKDIPFSGSIRNSSLNNVFHIISLTYPIEYAIDNDIITITGAQTP